MNDTSVWIGLFPTAKEAAQLAIPGGEIPEDIHLTLAYLGDYTKESGLVESDLLKLLADLVYYRDCTPEHGEVTGYGKFLRPPTYFAIPAVRGLLRFRSYIVEQLPTYNQKYTYVPHLTLMQNHYVTSPVVPIGVASTLTFRGVTLVHGGKRTLIPWTAGTEGRF